MAGAAAEEAFFAAQAQIRNIAPGTIVPRIPTPRTNGGSPTPARILPKAPILPLMPWQTAPGEGTVAPWTPVVQTPQGWQQPARPQGAPAMLPMIPAAGALAIPAAAGVGLTVAGVGLAAYGIAQGLGVEFPWETAPGEGFIAPWTERYETPEGTRQVRNGRRGMPQGDVIVSSWNTRLDGTGWEFYRLASGKLATYTKHGVFKTWRPYRSIVIGKKLTSSNVRRVATRINSHVRSLKKVLKDLK